MEKIELDLQTIKNFLVPFKHKISAQNIYETQDFLKQRGYTIKTIERASDSGALMIAYDFRREQDVFIKFIKHYDKDDFNEAMLYDVQTITIKSQYLLQNRDLICDLKNNCYFLIIEYSPLKNLSQFIKENTLTFQQTLQIVVNLLFGLNDIHNSSQVLMQLNPSNILVSQDLSIKILNLGSPFNTLQMIQKNNPFLPKEQNFLTLVTSQSNYYSLGAIICLLCKLDVQENFILSKNCKKGFFPVLTYENEYKQVLEVAFQMMNFNPMFRINFVQALQKLQNLFSPQLNQKVLKYLELNQVINYKQKLNQRTDLEIQSNGCIYIGDFDGNRRHGQGIFINLLGERYEGGFSNDKFHGQGSYYDKDGNVYIGEWFEGQMQGKGILYYNNTDLYDGNFFAGKRNGFGTLYFNKEEKYEGEWVQDQKEGYGKLKLLNNQKYEGQFKQGTFNGKGKFIYQDGSSYEGEWLNNQRHGYGEYKFQNGDRYLGNYWYDKKQGNGTYYYHTGSSYKGEWKNDLKTGHGLYTASNNETYEGSFKNGKRHGYGIYKYNNGLTYQGEWENDQKNGLGILLENNDIVFQGKWMNGQKQQYLNKEES
ncbi:protein kinase (macronuclear) [Tetrahymena thermophila SB210]|uniref:Protein kinase n=1 Tax=Tetrahymena thermophila (strain SB210) TaxID=312017 RepID=Q22Y00_TETTS|nr:protein kinase [Tetrahymena thermophila SB210]EAR90224.1 protein kinase [Tetrahymena thermophila SB210]|eukprot:XP_001010469.1 protein kinase [Tetrahymena thermophila SB210]